MWTSYPRQLDTQTTKTVLNGPTGFLSFREVLELLCTSKEFRSFFTASITASSFEAFFWETPPVTKQSWERPFEYVLVQSTSLSRLQPDSSPFEAHFRSRPGEDVLTFPNLGGDAMLIVPAPIADKSCYPHIGQFLRYAPASQVEMLWQKVGLAMQKRISESPVWLSTAGMGVPWLHLRLDSQPKYYRHSPYTVRDSSV